MLFIPEKDTRDLIDEKAAIEIIEQTAVWDDNNRIAWCEPSECTLIINEPKSRYRTKSCALLEIPVAGFRMIGYPQGAEGSAVSTRFVLLSDPGSGTPLALIDDHWNFTLRTAVSAIVGLRYLLPNKQKLAIGMLGAGNLARAMLMMLRAINRLGKVKVTSRRAESAARFAHECSRQFEVKVEAVSSVSSAVEGADVLVTATSANKQLVAANLVKPGMTICTLGRYELAGEIYKAADKVIFDKWDVAKDVPDVKELVAARQIGRNSLYAELNDLVVGRKKGRESDSETILFRTDGLVAQDVAIAWVVYQSALKQGRGIRLEGRGG